MAAANGGGGGGHVRSKSEPARAPEGLRHRSISMDSFDFYHRGSKKAEFVELAYQSVVRAVEDWRERRRAFMENLFSRLPEPIDFSRYIDGDAYGEDNDDTDDGAGADGGPDVDEDGDDDDDEDEDDPDIDGDDGGDGPDFAPAA